MIFVIFVGAPASLTRSYVMLALGWFILILGLELISFEFLAFAALLILAIAPKLIASLGFLLSFAGVFYIFLVIKWLKDYPVWFVSLIAIPVGIFLLMFPIGHFFFPNTTIWQLSSPILSVVFIVFYPVVAIFHLIGAGWVFDDELLWLFSLPTSYINVTMPLWMIVSYVILSIGAIFNKRVFFILLTYSAVITAWFMFKYLTH
jgi:competence protein ComEC